MLSTVALAPLVASNGVGDIGKEIAYARAHGFSDLTLVNGTEPVQGRPALLDSSSRAVASPATARRPGRVRAATA